MTIQWVLVASATLVVLYSAVWVLRLLAAHAKAARMRQRDVVGAHVEASFRNICVVVPTRHCEFCAAQLAQANQHELCQTCRLARVRT